MLIKENGERSKLKKRAVLGSTHSRQLDPVFVYLKIEKKKTNHRSIPLKS